MAQITSREELEEWLKDKPADWAQVIAARVALRVLPIALVPTYKWPPSGIQAIFRCALTFWGIKNIVADNITHTMSQNVKAIEINMGGYIPVDWNEDFTHGYEPAAEAAYHAIYAASIFDASEAATAASDAVYSADAIPWDEDTGDSVVTIWESVNNDALWLSGHHDFSAAIKLTGESLWLTRPVGLRISDWKKRLLTLNPTYQVWIDWYNRRISGNDAAFDIPGDTDRTEDKKILARLADATDEDFWDKGATYVNTTLQSWIDEARARVSALPEQDPAAVTYGVNDRGQLDRLPAQDQKHLRDVPDQQFLYGRIREAAFDLLGEGQRLGVPLSRALNRFAAAMPEDFAAALALPIWAEGIILRRLYRAHRIAFESKELSSDQLEPVVAEGLGGLLDLYNHFAFGDDGLRAKDETTIPPQERPSAEAEAAAAAPIAAALLKTPGVATDIVIDDITSEADAQPDGSPYDDQVRDHTNRNWRNRVAAILTGLRNRMVNFGVKTGDATYGAIVGVVVTETALGQFVATNAQDFITYVSTAFPTYNLGWLIEKIARLFG